ncbi:MAG: 4Fe-4S cluster-binding domain-containing protein [Nitrosopumilaceae archaeon]|nr:7-carboxy-7-deazaguanine synthase QueE [Nitrosopumilaceae archaeon]NIU01865.1 7-carboxy-7-deazaguanine synthase QueE [Nitrosopumilaceae archaeon]NIU88269.1 4Fe-4S cluster-binding domain-containing protein [Nitrosopumilaceae archaeon]NIV66561.1 4Fe-4S cluster-binding domain-containing protein [Nitrosopumilaceae archaeon]NIX62466.1 4Fe-4S cluster-binding domain-containing protein [Nitrosopumilaceae archaeon]
MKARIFEVFTSVEGEGILYGTKTLFVRLAGCPFKCFYCDTTDALPLSSGTEYDIDKACGLIKEKLEDNTFKVNFTGGDPLLQPDAVAQMAKYVNSMNVFTYLESSCFDSDNFKKVLPFIDFAKIEFKTIDSEFVDRQHYKLLVENAIECLRSSVAQKKTTYIKIVVSSKTDSKPFSELVNKIFQAISKDDIAGFVIQPTYGIAEPNLDLLLKLYDMVYPYYNQVRVVPQLHKFIGAP